MTDYDDPDHPLRLWPDDERRAAVTLGLLADKNAKEPFLLGAIADGILCGRPTHYVLALLKSLTNGLGEQFFNEEIVSQYQQQVGQCIAHEDDLRSRGEWRKDDTKPNGDNDNG